MVETSESQRGKATYTPHYIVDEETGELISVYIPTDAIIRQAQSGYKAGNPLLDDINEKIKQKGLIDKFRKLHKLKH